jgi:hypothetical protein
MRWVSSWTFAKSGAGRASLRKLVSPLVTIDASGWLISWAIDAASSPIVMTRVM